MLMLALAKVPRECVGHRLSKLEHPSPTLERKRENPCRSVGVWSLV